MASNLSQPPKIHTDFQIVFPKVEKLLLGNGMQVHVLRGHTSGIVRLDLVWEGGRVAEKYPAVAKSAMKCLFGGYSGMDSYQLAELYDFHGASVSHHSEMEAQKSTIAVLVQHAAKVIPAFLQSIFDVNIDNGELITRQNQLSERLKAHLQKNDILAYREITAILYGEDHAYGYNTHPTDYLDVDKWMILDYLKETITTKCQVVLSGDLTQKTEDSIIRMLEDIEPRKKKYRAPRIEKIKGVSGKKSLNGPQDKQAAIRMGVKTIDRLHEDHTSLKLVNVMLGGYFGSRLMTNIREKLGYCYHIDSSLESYLNDGILTIAADVNSENIVHCISEISHELSSLTTDEVSEDEFHRMKQFVRGQMLQSTDGVFSAAYILGNYLSKKLDETAFARQYKALEKLSLEHVRSIAKKYLNPEQFYTVIVGKEVDKN